jgi:hypothetical protein
MMLKAIFMQICESPKDCLQPSYLLTRIDDAFQCLVSIVDLPPEDIFSAPKSADNPQDAVLSKNGQKTMNGFHAMDVDVKLRTDNDHTTTSLRLISDKSLAKQRRYQISDLPQVLIDAAMDVVVATLLKFPSCDSSTVLIRNDARVLLRRLIRSGKVLARRHFNAPIVSISGENTVYGSANFLKLLQSLELSPIATPDRLWSAYTPFDLTCDMFEFCPDVSERGMVMSLRYALFDAHPRDIASFFIRNKSFPDDHSLQKQCVCWMEAMTEADSSCVKPCLQYKIVLAGAAFLITRMALYSRCNVSLLRDAYQNEFHPMEMSLCLGLIMDILSESNQFGLPSVTKNGMKNIWQHVAILCDCLDNCIRENTGTNDFDVSYMKTSLERVQKVVHSMTTMTSNLLSLQRFIPESDDHNPASIASSLERPDASEDKLLTPRKASTALPPYQIERLLF